MPEQPSITAPGAAIAVDEEAILRAWLGGHRVADIAKGRREDPKYIAAVIDRLCNYDRDTARAILTTGHRPDPTAPPTMLRLRGVEPPTLLADLEPPTEPAPDLEPPAVPPTPVAPAGIEELLAAAEQLGDTTSVAATKIRAPGGAARDGRAVRRGGRGPATRRAQAPRARRRGGAAAGRHRPSRGPTGTGPGDVVVDPGVGEGGRRPIQPDGQPAPRRDRQVPRRAPGGTPMSKKRVYLIIGADQRVRAAIRPQIRVDEIAIPIDLTFPNTWGTVVGAPICIVVPDFAPSTVESPDA